MLSPKRWSRLCRTLGARDPLANAFDMIRDRYNELGRYYHTSEHIRECLDHLDEVAVSVDDPASVEMAIWMHDVIYDPRAHDNEQRSADFAKHLLESSGVASETTSQINELILITRHSDEPNTHDECIIADIDLSILGATPDRFDAFERQVRAEYVWVPEAEFVARRAEILQGFRVRKSIYLTPQFRKTFEDQARLNLDRAIACLHRQRRAGH
ncbi:N-methyl-D-aspartate receptor NMDAR2C subunit [Planctomycetales bacterium ZRK34]|nr:N-methyl-D-aspartate receptor NMDAR2C subunit [Planctomycetales bacterium ZRK34]